MMFITVQQVENCGFVCWVDDEWPDSVQYALAKLWGMFDDCFAARIDERGQHTKLMQELCEEKNKWKKKHEDMIAEVNTFLQNTSKSNMQANYEKIQMEREAEDLKEKMQQKIELLESQVVELKKVQKTQEDVMRSRNEQWDNERAAMVAEKKKLEYGIYDLLKVKEKVKRIKAICDEPIDE